MYPFDEYILQQELCFPAWTALIFDSSYWFTGNEMRWQQILKRTTGAYLWGLWEREGCSPLARRSKLLLMVWKIQGFKVLRFINPNVQIPGHRATSFPIGARYWLRRYTETAFGLFGSSSSTVSSWAWFLALSAQWLQEMNKGQPDALKEAFHNVPVLIVDWPRYGIFILPLHNFQRSWQKPDNSLDSYHFHWPCIIQVPQLPVHSVPHIPRVLILIPHSKNNSKGADATFRGCHHLAYHQQWHEQYSSMTQRTCFPSPLPYQHS